MKRYAKPMLIALFIASIIGNVGLYLWGSYWKKALTNQFLTTYDVEQIFLEIEPNVTFEKISSIAMKKGWAIKIIEAGELQLAMGVDKRALRVNDTTLLFKSGLYVGSKSDHPDQ